VFPAKCVFCNAKGLERLDLCQHCFLQFKPCINKCVICAEPFEKSVEGGCGRCLAHKPFFDLVTAPYLYKGLAKDLVLKLKSQQNTSCSKILAQLMLKHWLSLGGNHIDAIVAVPSHKEKRKQRGFNQSGLLALHIAKDLKIPYQQDWLKRIKWSKNQTGLSRKKRINNIKNAFIVDNAVKLPKTLLLIDDVVTTGSTVNEVARVLKKAGVKQVIVLAFARTAK
jgi:ComF family protein